MRAALNEPAARAVVERLLREAAGRLTDPHHPPGCLAVHGALTCGEEAEPVRQALIAQRAAAQTALRDRFERARSESDLPPEADAADLACYVATLLHGMAVQAASGATRDELHGVAETALRAWPTGNRDA